MLFIGPTLFLSVSFFLALGLRYSFTYERMGVHSLLRIWLISKPFPLWSRACSILQIAHFACSQDFLVVNLWHSKVLIAVPYLLVPRYCVWLRAKEPCQES